MTWEQESSGARVARRGCGAAVLGFQATDAPLEQARESLTGDYSDQTMLYLIGGATAAVGGVALLSSRQALIPTEPQLTAT